MVMFFVSCICFILVDCIVITNAQAPNWQTPSSTTFELDGADKDKACTEVTQLVATSTDGSSVLYSLVSQYPNAGFAIDDDIFSGNKVLTCEGSSLTALPYTVVIRATHSGNGEFADKTLTITVAGVTPATGPICSQGTSLSLDTNDNTACDNVTSLTCTSTDSTTVSYSVISDRSSAGFDISGTTLTCSIGDITETTYTVVVRATNSGNSQTTDMTFNITASNLGSAIYMSFYIEGHIGKTTVTVDEHDAEIRFKCIVDSKLTPSVRIKFEDELVKEQINESSLSVVRQDISCFDTGIYLCEGRNDYKRSSINITLFVRCSPRPFRQILRNIGSSLHVPVTFSFTAVAFPEPGPKGFSWDKKEDEDWQPLLSNADLKISSSGLQSNLTVMNVSNADFGHYRLSVTNDIGTYKQSYYLYEKGMPQTSKENCTVTSDNATLIVAITLGVISVALAIYASLITVSRFRLKRKGTDYPNRLASQTTYDNQTFNVSGGREQHGSAASGEAATLQQYTDLIQFSNTDKDTYDVIKKL